MCIELHAGYTVEQAHQYVSEGSADSCLLAGRHGPCKAHLSLTVFSVPYKMRMVKLLVSRANRGVLFQLKLAKNC